MSKITELRPKIGGDSGGNGADCLIIEKTDNGYILRCLKGGSDEEAMMQECLVYLDRSELLRDVASRL